MYAHALRISIGLAFLALMVMPLQLQEVFPNMDKLGHFLIFGSLTFLLSGFISIRKAVFTSFFIGVVVECIQSFMITRSGSIEDVIANTTGVLFMWLILVVFSNKR